MDEGENIISEINKFLINFEEFSNLAYVYCKYNYYVDAITSVEEKIEQANKNQNIKKKEFEEMEKKLEEIKKSKIINVNKSYKNFLDITFDLMKKEYTFEEFKNECLEKLK